MYSQEIKLNSVIHFFIELFTHSGKVTDGDKMNKLIII